MGRDIHKEILQLKSRREFDTFWDIKTQHRKITSLMLGVSNLDENTRNEVLKFIPVKLAAMLESQLRSSIKKIIDEKENYFDNGIDLLPEGKSKIEFNYFKEMRKRTFSFGEFVSHQISCTDVSSFESTFSNLLYKKRTGFLSELQKYRPKSTKDASEAQYYDTIATDILKSISRVYELRHIVCHEMSEGLLIDSKELNRITKHTFRFSRQMYNYIADIIYPDSPETPQEMLQTATNNYENKEVELQNLLLKIKEKPTTNSELKADSALLFEAQKHWEDYRQKFAQSLVKELEGGHDYKILYLEELADITEDRIEDLKYYFNLDDK